MFTGFAHGGLHPARARRRRVDTAAVDRLAVVITRQESTMFDATTAQRLTTEGDWFEPYFISLGYRLGNVLVLSGQASLSEQGELVGVGDFDAQAAQTFANIERVLALAGAGLEDNFTPPYPADTIVEVRSLALPELMIEIEVMAMVPDGERRVIDA
jgi:enamine deaminase RidA (YjgF/YER057c/UK114 family)